MNSHAANRVFVAIVLAGALLGAPVWAAQRGGDQNSRPDTPGTGPYPAMKEEIPALPRHVVYRPANVPAMGAQKLGVVAWGNGGCSDDAASARFHLLELASHGYLVIASGRILSGSPALGSWINYGLGTVNENLPGFVVIGKAKGNFDPTKVFGSAFLPAEFQSTYLTQVDDAIPNLKPGLPAEEQRAELEVLRTFNERHLQGR